MLFWLNCYMLLLCIICMISCLYTFVCDVSDFMFFLFAHCV